MSNSLCSKNSSPPPSPSEESGWTTYFEDLLASREAASSSNSSLSVGSSLLSDATSCIASKPDQVNKQHHLTFKKRKKACRGVLHDDPLEDTATSPLTTPKFDKVLKNLLHENPTRENRGISMDEGHGKCMEVRRDGRGEVGFVDRGSECTELCPC